VGPSRCLHRMCKGLGVTTTAGDRTLRRVRRAGGDVGLVDSLVVAHEPVPGTPAGAGGDDSLAGAAAPGGGGRSTHEPEAHPTATDGRLARGARTRRLLAEALVNLLQEGDPHPTANRIAQRAGVSLRLVFHHFDDLESVLRAAVAVQEERHWHRFRPVSPSLPLEERIRAVVRQRADVFRAVLPVRRAADRLIDTSPTVAAETARVRNALRSQLAETFAPELERLDPNAGRGVLDALDVAVSWATFDQMQRHGRSVAACRRTMELLATAVLALPAAEAES